MLDRGDAGPVRRVRSSHLVRAIVLATLVIVPLLIVVLSRGSDDASPRTAGDSTVEPPLSVPVHESTRIVFASEGDRGVYEIHVINDDGTDELVVSAGLSHARAPAWSPDRERIAFVRVDVLSGSEEPDQDLFVMNADGGDVVKVTSGPDAEDHPAWSPDASTLVFTVTEPRTGRSRISATSIAQGVEVPLSRPPEGCSDREPAWSPDGSRIAFSRKCGDEASALYVMNSDGTGVALLTDFGRSPDWSPDGGRIAYTGQGNAGPAVFVMDVEDGRKVLLTKDFSGDPTWSPDGSRIAFTRSEFVGLRLYSINVDGTGVVRLTESGANQVGPSW